MEIRNEVVLEIKKESRTYIMQFPLGAPIGEAYDACISFLNKLVQVIEEETAKLKPKTPEEVEKEGSDEKKD